MVRIPVNCPGCGTRYSIKSSSIGKSFKCKCGSLLRATRDSASAKNAKNGSSPEMLTSNPGKRDDSFLNDLSDALASVQNAGPENTDSKAPKESRRLSVTTAMGPYAGRLTFIALTIIVLLLANFLLLACSISPLDTPIILLPFAILAFIYTAIAVNANKIVVEIDDKRLAIRFLKRIPWPVFNKSYPLDMIRSAYVEHSQVTKPWFSNAHSNDTDESYMDNRITQYVYAYCLMGNYAAIARQHVLQRSKTNR